eukprot:TRINITY_DN2004_c0_g2_i2.p1 TRINITY_DN2004_c0_g2~~TRINITY_DN2004_c0_g2_i2.p1  ORF type:complete len:125 (-),score=33.64 TRINITY_DN2004_c0_g2_i2:13-387(-)
MHAERARRKELERALKEESHRVLLISKFKEKYGTSQKAVGVMNRLVSEYVKITPHITEESLARLDMGIKRIILGYSSANASNENKKMVKEKKLESKEESIYLSLIHICRCRRIERCRSRWSPYH